MSDFFSDFKLVSLTGAIVSQVQNVIAIGDSIILRGNVTGYYNGDGACVIGLFTSDGEFVRPIVKAGRGPGEVLTVEDVRVNKYTGTLDVLCDYGQNICQYDLRTFEMTGKHSLGETDIVVANNILPMNESSYLVYKQYPYSPGQDYKVYVYDAKEKAIKSQFIEMDEALAENLAFDQSNNLFEYDGDMYYYEGFGKYMYEYANGDLIPYMGFEENKYTLPDNALESAGSDLMKFVGTLESVPPSPR